MRYGYNLTHDLIVELMQWPIIEIITKSPVWKP